MGNKAQPTAEHGIVITSHPSTKAYHEGWERIWGDKKGEEDSDESDECESR